MEGLYSGLSCAPHSLCNLEGISFLLLSVISLYRTAKLGNLVFIRSAVVSDVSFGLHTVLDSVGGLPNPIGALHCFCWSSCVLLGTLCLTACFSGLPLSY